MSEKTSSSESVSETAKPESISRPPGKGRNVLLMIVAIVIVIALIATAFVMMLESNDEVELTVEIQGPTDLEVDAGSTQNFTVVVKYGDEIVTNDTSRTKLFWSVAPTDIGVLMLKGKGEVPFRAGIVAGTGAVNCTATFQETDESDEIEVSDQKVLKVLPPFLDAVSFSPIAKTIEPGKNWTFTATAVSSVGLPITGVTFEWSITSEPNGAATLSSTTGTSVVVSGSVLGYANLSATGSYSGATKSGTSAIKIGYLPPRSLDTVWYDMFEVPIGPWYDARFPIYGEEEVVSHSNPSLFFYHSGDGGKYLYTLMRMNVTGENVPEINTNIRPEFLPMLSPTVFGDFDRFPPPPVMVNN